MDKRRKYNVNESFFETIDTEEKSYFLGLLYSDGCNSKHGNCFNLALKADDDYIIYKMRKAMESEHPIKYKDIFTSNTGIPTNICMIQINSRKISKDLSNLGCISAKSLVKKFPTKIPDDLIHHFIRGYFDGNGSVWQGKRIKCWVKDKTYKAGGRERIIHNVKFNITSSNTFLIPLVQILSDKLGFKNNKLNTSKNIGNCAQMEYSGRLQMRKFYDFIYKDASMFLTRKKDKFEEIINYNLCVQSV